MLKVLRLTTDNLRNFSLFQLNKLFKQAATNRIVTNIEPSEPPKSATMSTAETNGSLETTASASASTATSEHRTQNLDGIVKFLELLGNLKVRQIHFRLTFNSVFG